MPKGKHNGRSLTTLNNSVPKAKANTNRTGGQAEFKGNANTPIKTGANEKRVTQLLGHHAQRNTQVGKQSKALLNHLGKTGSGWKVTAGVHQGGLGGSAGAADQRDHITLSTGHHLRFNKNGQLMEITGKAGNIPQGKGRSHAAAAGR